VPLSEAPLRPGAAVTSTRYCALEPRPL